MTFGPNVQQLTIEQPFPEKISVVQDRIIVAGTGQIGLGQRFTDSIEQLWNGNDFKDVSIVEIGRRIATKTIQDFGGTGAGKGSYGALVAIPNQDTPELIEFSVQDFQPEVKTKGNWYASMGSGQIVADPLLGFVRTTLWGDEPPNRQEGIFAVALVLGMACQMAPVGVALPIQIAMLFRDPGNKGRLTACRLTEEELLEHRDAVDRAIEYFKNYRTILVEDRTGSSPPAAPK